MALTQLEWLRKLLEDVPRVETDKAAGDGTRTDFYFGNPPSTGSVLVWLDGVATAAFVAIDVRGIRMNTAPGDSVMVTVQYQTSTWPDDELTHYLEQGALDWTTDRDVVYCAAVYGIDSLLVGLAMSLEFGAGAEQFNMPGVYERLLGLRGMFTEVLAQSADAGTLDFVDFEFPSRDPSYPGGFYGGYIDGELS